MTTTEPTEKGRVFTSTIELVEFADGIYLRYLPVKAPKGFRDIDIRCAHAIPTMIYKPDVGYRMHCSLVGEVLVQRCAADGDAPACGCWILIARGELAMETEAFLNGVQVNMTSMVIGTGP
ncbi:hypothetical protein [Nocardia sp. NBC_01327]|uniref:hypothetical protein n=1 Tax=Nocardia sp. NBC_01327 TaxID=2903593 RepID=UPI002E0FC32B|nr:hypothetical protein OG326_23705 [Nocardia sp. NBC_01327]